MLPKYGLFDFFEWHSVDVTDICNVEWGDREVPTDHTAVIEDGTVIGVKWPVAVSYTHLTLPTNREV